MDALKKLAAIVLIVLLFVMVANPGLALYISFKVVGIVIAWALINGACKLITKKSILELLTQ